MRSILDHASKILFNNDTQPLLTPSFWILPLYRELLNSGALPQKELVVAQDWSRSSARKTRSREENESTMLGRLTRMIEGDLPNGLGRAA